MGRSIVKQPNGFYAVWSSVVDDFIVIDASAEEIISEYVTDAIKEIEVRVNAEIENIEEKGKSHRTFEECIRIIKSVHGKDAESLKELGLIK